MLKIALRTKFRNNSAARRWKAGDFFATAFETELGWMAIAERDEVLTGVGFGHPSERQAQLAIRKNLGGKATSQSVVFLKIEEQPNSIADVVERLTAYAAGEDVDFSDVVVDEQHLTDFGRRIVQACRRIPRGKTRSYGELAASCGSPGAARAVGQVMARNRYPLIVPCHRVLAAGGLLGGFSAPQGLAMKLRLLELEREALLS